MSLETLANIGEFVGGLAVIISLLYVAHGLRTNTRTMCASSAAVSQDSLASLNELVASDPELAELLARATERRTLEGFKREEVIRLSAFLRAATQRFESMYFRYEARLLEERVWEVRRKWLAGFLKLPYVAEWWSAEREISVFMPEFIADLESVRGVDLDSVRYRAM